MGMKLRQKVVGELDTLVKRWIKTEGLRQGKRLQNVEKLGGKVVTYGSSKLGVVDRESDLDLLCVVPHCVTREHFFDNFYELLSRQKNVAKLRKLVSAFVPVIKMTYCGIEVDMTMSRLVGFDTVPEDEHFLFCDQITWNMDQKCLRSL